MPQTALFPIMKYKKVKKTLTFDMLDAKLGDDAPFLISLSDGLQEELRLVIAGAIVGNTDDNIPDFEGTDDATKRAIRAVLAKTRPIEANEQCSFEICFHNYITYRIRNESFSSYDPEAIGNGRYLIIFEKSEFLSNLHITTDAQVLDDGSYYPGKWIHYGIYTQNHIIDVIAQDAPDISEIKNTNSFASI